MTRKEIINGLKMSMDLTLFDPSTGEVMEPWQLNEVNRTAYEAYKGAIELLEEMPSAQPDASKYEYHYDHTDCIWYRPEARNRCPVTCAQYRDGWNGAMNYIFRDGKLQKG